MINTYTSYQLITRDIGKSLSRVEKQPMVQRETQYFLENIGKVKTAEEFVGNTRLFNYAMKAFGLEDMAYAKAFMLKALKEGVEDPNSFANKLTDKRYAEFVEAFNFAAHGEAATTYNTARDATIDSFISRATLDGLLVLAEADEEETAYFRENIGAVESIDDLMADDRLLLYALRAFHIEDAGLTRASLEAIIAGGVADPDSPANTHEDKNVARFAAAFDFAALGEKTTSHVAARDISVARYARQTLEQDAGNQNEGVRLALYFERKAGNLTNAYEILADQALATVVRTALGLPDAIAQLDVDKQARMIESRIDFDDFGDPAKLEKFISRFTTLWEINNPSTQTVSPAVAILSQPVQFGISADTMMAIALMKR